jgi:hypothetical protein
MFINICQWKHQVNTGFSVQKTVILFFWVYRAKTLKKLLYTREKNKFNVQYVKHQLSTLRLVSNYIWSSRGLNLCNPCICSQTLLALDNSACSNGIPTSASTYIKENHFCRPSVCQPSLLWQQLLFLHLLFLKVHHTFIIPHIIHFFVTWFWLWCYTDS